MDSYKYFEIFGGIFGKNGLSIQKLFLSFKIGQNSKSENLTRLTSNKKICTFLSSSLKVEEKYVPIFFIRSH